MWESTQFLFRGLAVIGGTECSSVVEQWLCKLCAAGSIPAFPIPTNCHRRNKLLLGYSLVSSTPRWVASYGSSPCTGIFV